MGCSGNGRRRRRRRRRRKEEKKKKITAGIPSLYLTV